MARSIRKFATHLLFCLFIVNAVSAAPTYESGNLNIANTILHGAAHMMVVGDSEQNGMIAAYPAALSVDHWSGYGAAGPNLNTTFAGNSGVYDFGFTNPFQASASAYYPDDAGNLIPGAYSGRTEQVVFNGHTVPDTGNGTLANRIYSVSMNSVTSPPAFQNGYGWISNNTSTITANVLYWANPNGINSGVEVRARINDNSTVAMATINAYSPVAQWKTATFSLPAQTWTSGGSVNFDFRLPDNSTPQAGSNFITAGVNFVTNTPGFTLGNMSRGGENLNYFLDRTKISDAGLAATLTFNDTNVAMIWLGQNGNLLNDAGVVDDSEANFKARMLEFIARCKTLRPGMQFVLVSTYDTETASSGTPRLSGESQALREISLSDPDVLFLDQYDFAGSSAFLNANGYLSDGVHPSVAGLPYFAGNINSMLESASASSVPEPVSGTLAIGLLFALARRPQRAARR